MMKDAIFFLLGLILLSGGRYGNSENFSNTNSNDAANSIDLNICLSRMEKLEGRLEDLEYSQADLQDQLAKGGQNTNIHSAQFLSKVQPNYKTTREEIFKFGDCATWVENNQVFFQGCNVHIVNTTGLGGAIDHGDGLGNLIIGSNSCPPANPLCDPQNPGYPNVGTNVDVHRMGSHNIIVGERHIWKSEAINSVIFGL